MGEMNTDVIREEANKNLVTDKTARSIHWYRTKLIFALDEIDRVERENAQLHITIGNLVREGDMLVDDVLSSFDKAIDSVGVKTDK